MKTKVMVVKVSISNHTTLSSHLTSQIWRLERQILAQMHLQIRLTITMNINFPHLPIIIFLYIHQTTE